MNKIQENIKKYKKEILIGAGGVTLLITGILIGKKIGIKVGKDSVAILSNEVRDNEIAKPIPTPEGVSEIWKQIDEDVFLDVADKIENALIDLNVDNLHYERSWEVAEGVTKTLNVVMSTVKE